MPPIKYELVAQTEKRILDIESQYKMGFMTDQERYKQVVAEWEKTTNEVSDALQKNLDRYNPIFMMADSGARGSMKQIRQLAGMRGLIANTAGRTIEIPIKANYREGLTALEYFISSRGARKGLADTALRTADSGYLTRRMVDVSQDVIIREQDCGVTHGIRVSEISENGQVIEKFSDRLRGRFLVSNVYDADTGAELISSEKMMDESDAKLLETRHWVQENHREGDACTFDPTVEGSKPIVMYDSLLFWGVPKIYQLGFGVRAASPDEIPAKILRRIHRETDVTAEKINRNAGRSGVSVQGRFWFYATRFAHKHFKRFEPDYSYWEQRGWHGKQRPWKIAIKSGNLDKADK